MDREDLESLEKLLAAAKATPLPWRSEPPNDDTPHMWIVADGNSGICKIETCDYDDGKGERHTEEDLYNGDLILTAVNELPALLSHIRELEGENERLRKALEPFAALADVTESFVQDRVKQGGSPKFSTDRLRVAHFQDARAALKDQ